MKTRIKIIFSIAMILPIMALALTNSPNEEMNMPLGDDVEAGKALFTAKACFACHGMNGEGNALGPNMTDNFTKQGCSEEDMIRVITKGVAGTAMVPYEAQMTPEEIKQVTAYIISLKGSTPANAKAAEGDECK